MRNFQQEQLEEVKELNKTVWVKLAPSKISGIGIIAIRNIPKGVQINQKGRGYQYHINERNFKKIKKEIREIILDRKMMSPGGMFFSHPNRDASIQSFMNHSKDPNTNGHTTFRKIKKGEELTEDYRTMTGPNGIKETNPLQLKHFNFFK